MIVDSPQLTQLVVGTDRVIPQAGDSQVIVPSSIQPVTEPILPITLGGTGSAPQQNSLLVSINVQRTNIGAQVATIATLQPGLYEFTIVLLMRSSYLGTGAGVACSVGLLIGSSENNLAHLYSVIGSDHQIAKHRILLQDGATLRFNTEAVAVSQTLDVYVSVNIGRIL